MTKLSQGVIWFMLKNGELEYLYNRNALTKQDLQTALNNGWITIEQATKYLLIL